MSLIKENKIIIFILFLTLFKGLIWAFTIPVFQAPDEAAHYGSIQTHAQPSNHYQTIDNTLIKTKNFSPQLRILYKTTESENIRLNAASKYSFNDDSNYGENEKTIRNDLSSRFSDKNPSYNTYYSPIYYSIGALIENGLAFYNIGIIERLYAIRIFSVLLGTLTTLLAYLAFKNLNLTSTEAALLAGILSFQPMLTFINASVSVDALLYLAFSLFILGGVRLLKNGMTPTNILTIIGATALCINTKPSGYFTLPILVLLLFIYTIQYQQKKILALSQMKKATIFIVTSMVIAGIGIIGFVKLKLIIFSNFKSLDFILSYIKQQLHLPITINRSLSYWGNFGWLTVPFSRYIIFFIWIILGISLFGLVYYIVYTLQNWKITTQKKNVLFFQVLFLIFTVIGINLINHFINIQGLNPNDVTDTSRSINNQGRYFFPAIVAKFFLITLGISFLFRKIKKEITLFILLILMILLNMVAFFNYLIPRYYL